MEEFSNLFTELSFTIIRLFLICSPVVGMLFIYGGIKRWMDGNSGPHQGKGAFTKVLIGAAFLNAKIVIIVILNTLIRSGFDRSGKILAFINQIR